MQTLSESFAKGIEALQTKDPKTAVELFRQALSQHPEDPAVLTNLGISLQQNGEPGWAIAYLRKAQTLGSSLKETGQALEFSLSQLQVKEIPHDIELWEQLRQTILIGIPLPWLVLFNGLALLLFGSLLISFLRDRRKAFEEELVLPNLKVIHWFAGLALVCTLTLVVLKVWDLSEVRGTIVAEKVPANSAPSAEAPSLFELYPGLEVLVQRSEGDWYQVKYPGGPTGWIKKDQIFITQSADLLLGAN